MTMVITPEIPRAKDAQDVGFRWVSFTRASPPKVGQFWMRANNQGINWLEFSGSKAALFQRLWTAEPWKGSRSCREIL
ncbi:hypothetical protein, partial [Stenotrophomonas maltophilia group sp. Smal12]|uniref:hypothetical protein n=1 Tax=Stenotrophomonas maltophilia group sp. Smal12 TaxID=3050414 RepID=UPI00300F1CAF